ncbi:FtsX-like permease family protein [Colwellia sp. UCD-KL20]|uniref:ABC transporter permease n=1 Tax=Colwellia sp. UCD-KL20 TaxID=1917165 RepID=UPI0009708E70|nr:FtsX-like permease family protein [Colwellia sp. UCD-KL20]
MLLSVAWRSLLSRKKTVILTFLSLTISILVLLSVEHIRLQAKESFNRTISGVDLIVGAPSGQLNLLLYSVFRMGSPANNIHYESFNMLEKRKEVDWAIPISLGDSHRGFRVVGTNNSYFIHYKYGEKNPLEFKQGNQFSSLFDVVLGADVAKKFNYKLGDKIVIAHGIGNTSFTQHKQAPFVISGILAVTGTPVDKSVHVSLGAIEAIHLSPAALKKYIDDPNTAPPIPKSITAVMLKLKSKLATFSLQREINNYTTDRLMAVLPGVAMTELWGLMATMENLLRVIAVLVLISSLFGLSTMLLASMNERQTEIAVLRMLGAGPLTLLMLILLEAFILVSLAIFISAFILTLALYSLDSWLAAEFGLFLSGNIFSVELIKLMAMIFIATLVVSLLPALEAYKNALHSQLSSH